MYCLSISVLKSSKSIILAYVDESKLISDLLHKSDYLVNCYEGHINKLSKIYCSGNLIQH